MKSMTGFGRGMSSAKGMNLETTVRTLNHRYSQVKVQLSAELFEYEPEIRKRVQQNISRGSVEVFMKLEYPMTDFSRLELDHILAREYLYNLNKLNSTIDIPGLTLDNSIRLDSLLNLESIWNLKMPDFPAQDVMKLIFTSLDQALQNVLTMRTDEGNKLKTIIHSLFDEIRNMVPEIQNKADQHQEITHNRLKHKIQEKCHGLPIDEQRLEEEIVYYQEKSDITEELDRLNTHLQSAAKALAEEIPVGRKLEFIIQEMFREVNTLGVKATLSEISTKVVVLKTHLDKLKEQIQNIE